MSMESAFTIALGERQLFLDDHHIVNRARLTRAMHRPAKKGAVVRPTDPEAMAIQIRTAPAWVPDEQIYKLWDISTPASLHAQGVRCVGYYESTDGLHWTRPVVGQVELRGSRRNHYVTVRTKGGYVAPFHVVYDASDPDPGRRYKAAINDGGFLVSPDGVDWTPLDVPKVPSQDESNLSFDRQGPRFLHTVKQRGPYGRSVWLATSKDFAQWTEPELIFHADEVDQERGASIIAAYLAGPMPPLDCDIPDEHDADWQWENVDVYNMGVFRYEGLYIGLPAVYYRKGRRYTRCIICFTEIQLTYSRDLKTWHRLGDRQPFIACAPVGSGAYDLSKNLPPSAPVVRGDELWFYYTGIKYQGSARYDDLDRAAVCLAVLRRDGFMSLDAGEQAGTVLTKPFDLPGDTLFVNVNCHPDKDQAYWRLKSGERLSDALKGECGVEVLDRAGNVVAVSVPIKGGDHPRAEVKWRQDHLADLKGRKVSLRFTLRQAQLYSYWIE